MRMTKLLANYGLSNNSLALVSLLHLLTEIISLNISELKKVKKEFKAYQYAQYGS